MTTSFLRKVSKIPGLPGWGLEGGLVQRQLAELSPRDLLGAVTRQSKLALRLQQAHVAHVVRHGRK